MLSQIVDTLIFITVAFYGVRPIADLIVGQAIAKVILSIVLVPLLIMLLVGIGRRLDRRPALATSLDKLSEFCSSVRRIARGGAVVRVGFLQRISEKGEARSGCHPSVLFGP